MWNMKPKHEAPYGMLQITFLVKEEQMDKATIIDMIKNSMFDKMFSIWCLAQRSFHEQQKISFILALLTKKKKTKFFLKYE